jgi:glycosyltransferase involved in cell wall biosynthesis
LAYADDVRKRRVMQLVLSLSPGGTERLVIEICKQLTDRIDAMVCCLDDRGSWAAELEALNIPVVALRREPGFQPSLARHIARLIRTNGIEVVHCHHYSPYVYGVLASVVTGAQLVFTEHGRLSNDDPSLKRRLVNPFLSMLGGSVCAVSNHLKQHMVAEGFPSRRIQVVYNGIDPARRPTAIHRHVARELLGLPADAFVIGTVGRLDRVKNLRVMLQAHAWVLEKHPGARAVIVGDGTERAALEAAAAELGLSESVTFAGYRSDVRAIIPAFDVYLNCSTYEGISLTILEAMAAGLPVVATPVGGNPEVVIDQETGFLVSGRPRAIADAIVRLADDPRSRHMLGDAARWRVMRHFSIARMVSEYAALYLGLASHATIADPDAVPTAAEAMSVRDATRSAV